MRVLLEITDILIEEDMEDRHSLKSEEKSSESSEERRAKIIERMEEVQKEADYSILSCQIMEIDAPKTIILVESEVFNQRAKLTSVTEEPWKKFELACIAYFNLKRIKEGDIKKSEHNFFNKIEKSSLNIICGSLRRYVWQNEPSFPSSELQVRALDLMSEKKFVEFAVQRVAECLNNKESDGGLLRTLLLLCEMKKEDELAEESFVTFTKKDLKKVLAKAILNHKVLIVHDLFQKRACNENVERLAKWLEEEENLFSEEEKVPIEVVDLRCFNLVDSDKVTLLLESICKHKNVCKLIIPSANKYNENELNRILSPVNKCLQKISLSWFAGKSTDFLKNICAKEIELKNFPHVKGDSLAENLSQIAQIERLSMKEFNNLASSFFQSFSPNIFKNITSLIFNNMHSFSDEALSQICEFSNLKLLDISGCDSITSKGLKKISKMEFLETVRASHCGGLTEKTKLEEMENLKAIDFSNTAIGNSLLFSLSECKLLDINLENTDITERGLNAFFNDEFERVQVLRLMECDVSDKFWGKLFASATKLKRVSLSNMSKRTFTTIETREVEILAVQKLKASERTCKYIFACMPKLKKLKISNSILESAHLRMISLYCPNLVSLKLGNIENQSLKPISLLKKLKKLNLGNSRLRREDLAELFHDNEMSIEKISNTASYDHIHFDFLPSFINSCGYFVKRFLLFYRTTVKVCILSFEKKCEVN